MTQAGASLRRRGMGTRDKASCEATHGDEGQQHMPPEDQQSRSPDSFTKRIVRQAGAILGTDRESGSFSSSIRASVSGAVASDATDTDELGSMGNVELQWLTLRFPDAEREVDFVAKSFRGYYEMHQAITCHLCLTFFLAFWIDGRGGAGWVPPSLVVLTATRRWLHGLRDRQRAQRLGKWVALAITCCAFGAVAFRCARNAVCIAGASQHNTHTHTACTGGASRPHAL